MEKQLSDYNLEELQSKLTQSIQQEEYELAHILQQEIDARGYH